MKSKEYKILFENETVFNAKIYFSMGETKVYLFVKQKDGTDFFTYRIHKKTLKMKGISQTSTWDVKSPIKIIELPN